MPKLAANLSMLFTEEAFPDRFAAAARAGFKGVEFLFPYDYEAEMLAERLRGNDLEQVLFNLPPGDWEAGERGLAALPGRTQEFQDGVGRALEYARALGAKRLHAMAGIAPEDADREKMLETYVDNLMFAAAQVGAAGIVLVIEPINTRDMPGYFLNTPAQALAVMDTVKLPNLKMLYDVYHAQIMAGDISHTLETHLDRIAHVQIAETPGRHEPGTGEIDYGFLLGFLDRIGYEGWVGCEYRPAEGTAAGLGWAAPYLGAGG